MRLIIYMLVFTGITSCTNSTHLLIQDKTFTHKNEVKNGTYVKVDSAGRFDLIHFENGKLNGAYFRYYRTGRVWVKGNYSKGKKAGKWSYYFVEGICAGTREYRNGKCIVECINGCPKF